MHLINCWASAGLILDILGVLILFEYGLPSKVEGETGRTIGDSQEVMDAREKKNRFIKTMSFTGLSLICIGFFLQLIATNLSFVDWLIHKLFGK